MRPEVSVHVDRDARVEKPLVVVGAPTAGLVGTIVAQYLVSTLELPLVGGVRSPAFPPVGGVRDGLVSAPVRVYAKEMACGLENACKSLVVIETEFIPGRAFAAPTPHEDAGGRSELSASSSGRDALLGGGAGVYEGRHVLHAFANAVTAWAREKHARLLTVPDAIPEATAPDAGRGAPGESPVFAIASTPRARDVAPALGIARAASGSVVGLTATLLLSALHTRLDALALVSPSRRDVPDARAAARIVEAFDKLVPAIDIETRPLIEEAERIEGLVREHQAEMEAQARLAAGDSPMYL